MPSCRAILGAFVAASCCAPVLAAPGQPLAARGLLVDSVLEVIVVEADTGHPVPWANVLLKGGGGGLADKSGVCRLTRLSPGPLEFRVLHVAYQPSSSLRGLVVAGEVSRVTVRLEPLIRELDPVAVQEDRAPPLSESARGRVSIDAATSSALPNPSDDPFQLIRFVPGALGNDVGSDFHLRGGGVEETLVRIDGMEVRSLFHGRDFGGLTGIVPLGIVEQLDVHSAAFPAELGGRTSGAIDVALRDQGANGLHGAFAADVTAARALIEQHGRRGSLFVSAREGYLGSVLGAIQDDAVIQPAYRDLLLRGIRRIGPSTSIRGNYLRVEDHVRYEDGIATHDVDADYLDQYVWSGVRWIASRRIVADGTAFAATSSQGRRTGPESIDNLDARRVGGRLEMAVGLGSHIVEAGLEAEREWTDTMLRNMEVVAVRRDGTVESVDAAALPERAVADRSATWIQDEWAVHRRLSLNIGMRLSHDTFSDDLVFGPRLGGALFLPSGWLLRGAWGRHAQPPRREANGQADLLVLSERVQSADHALVGLERKFGGFRLGTEAWEKRFHPLDAVVTREVDGVVERHVISHGLARGIEVYARHDGRSTAWWLAYALGRSEWSDGRSTYSRDFDALHALALANTLNLGANWDVGVTYRFRTGTPYTAQMWHRDAGENWVLDEGGLNAERLPDYHRIDLRLRRRFRFDGWEASLWGEALNLTNHDNVLWYAWRLRDPGGAVRADAERVRRTGVPGIPSVGFEVRF